ncbi:serine hydrolase [uncultured Phycicoccus sp.]|uniref:serine hydrolase domain-containing protein n=1 Tax=uncultured Phycicoccus sp. TaxID=661422 RepID=UPI0026334D93|nr:serine hydrolase [uncultured Phycicoccus sp.]
MSARSGAALFSVLMLAACTGSRMGSDPSVLPTTRPAQTPILSSRALPWPAPPTSALPADRSTPMLAEMQRWIDREFMPGATAAVVSPYGVWSAAVGVDGQGARLEPTSGMSLGNVTQTFVAAEALLLAEQGKLDLDRPASTYVPARQLANGVTTRQLLGHRAGIPDPGQEPYAAVFTTPDTHWSTKQFLAPVPKATAPPGETFYEDTTNYVLAALVLEKVSGRSTATAIDGDLWTPLGLERLAYQDEQRLPEPIAAPGEDEDLPQGQTGRPYLPFRSLASAIAASHGVAGDAASVAQWGYALYGGLVLAPASVAQLTDFDQNVGPGYGLATFDFTTPHWLRWNIDGYGMRGGTVGYRSVVAVYPAHNLSVAILSPSTVDVLPYVRHLVNAGLLLD